MDKPFLVIDTEGSDILKEIAVLNSRGELLYEAFTEENKQKVALKTKSLMTISEDLERLLENKKIVCHYAQHDYQVILNSFRKCRKSLPKSEFICTVELAKNFYPNFESYSLKYLAKKLLLKVNQQFFSELQAHRARYDAEFTLQLYLHLLSMSSPQSSSPLPQNLSNPFSSNRVDNPFQNHLDFDHIYRDQFNYLCSIIDDIKADPNQQSKGALIIGEAGSGKTHLMMRLAKNKLITNRLFYIRHPNNYKAVNHHIYARILESFAQKVSLEENTERTQLDLLLARSFTRILEMRAKEENNLKLNQIIETLQNDSLTLFDRLGTPGTQKYRSNWHFIETRITQWWEQKYSAGGYAPIILKGIIKFCTYKDNLSQGINYKEQLRRWLAGDELESEVAETIGLKNWQEELSREEFALEAMTLFGQLSTLDEPLIIIFDQLESLINNHSLLISFGDAIREILSHVPNSLIIVNLFPDRWQKFQEFFDASTTERLSQHFIALERPSNQDLEKILQLKCASAGVTLEQIFTHKDLELILRENSIRKVINQAAHYFRYKTENIPLPETLLISQESKSNYSDKPLEQRIKELETALQNIANVCLPIINNLSSDSGFSASENKVENSEDSVSLPLLSEELIISPAKILVNSPEESTENLVREKKVETGILSPKILGTGKTEEIITYLKDTEKILGEHYNRPQIITDDDDWGKLLEIIEAFKVYDQTLQIDQMNFGKRVLPNHLSVINKTSKNVIGFLNVGGTSFTTRIKNFNALANAHKHLKFTLFRDARENLILGKVGNEEIEKLNFTKNGQFVIMNKAQRVSFELIYKMIVDINEGDLEVKLSEALNVLISEYKDCWLIKMLNLNSAQR